VTTEHKLGVYTFLSGVLFGVCGGAIITLLVEFIDARREDRKKEEKEMGATVAEK